jgi:heme exporter protein A
MRLVAENLAALRGERLVFRNVAFTVEGGQALVLHGPNGSGKTTLLRVIAGLLSMMAGRVRLVDDNGEQLLDEKRDRSIHFVGHQDVIRSQLRVHETVQFHAALLGAPASAVPAALDAWGLDQIADLSCSFLSAGQRRRLTLARLSLQKRPLWLLDEPLVALDTLARARLNNACTKHVQDGGLLVVATHEPFMGDQLTLHLGPTQ